MLAPYVATGWWPAARARAELLEGWGRAEEAIASTRSYAEAGGLALEFFARLLARHGLLDEAVEPAQAHPESGTRYAAWTISDLLAGAGRTEEAVTVLRPHASACRGLPAGHLIDLGRVEDAVTLLQQRGSQPAVPVRTGAFPAEPPF